MYKCLIFGIVALRHTGVLPCTPSYNPRNLTLAIAKHKNLLPGYRLSCNTHAIQGRKTYDTCIYYTSVGPVARVLRLPKLHSNLMWNQLITTVAYAESPITRVRKCFGKGTMSIKFYYCQTRCDMYKFVTIKLYWKSEAIIVQFKTQDEIALR